MLLVHELLLRGEREPVLNWLRGAVARVVERELTAEPGVLKRGSGRVQKGREQTRRSGGELGARVLEVSLQLHPSVLKPGLHLWREKLNRVRNYKSRLEARSKMHHQASRHKPHKVHTALLFIYLSFREAKLLGDLPPLRGAQVLVPAEGVLQPVDLLRRELGPHPAVEAGLPLAVLPLLALRARRVATAICCGENRP